MYIKSTYIYTGEERLQGERRGKWQGDEKGPKTERERGIVCKGNRRFGILFRWFRGQTRAYLVE